VKHSERLTGRNVRYEIFSLDGQGHDSPKDTLSVVVSLPLVWSGVSRKVVSEDQQANIEARELDGNEQPWERTTTLACYPQRGCRRALAHKEWRDIDTAHNQAAADGTSPSGCWTSSMCRCGCTNWESWLVRTS
jgi:hypothetical protein